MDKGFYLLKLVYLFLCMDSKRLWEGKQVFMFHYAFKFGKLTQMQVGYGKIFTKTCTEHYSSLNML